MKVLVSAYACRPGAGSELGVGWEFVRVIAAKHDTWVLTHPANADEIEAHKVEAGLADVHFEYVTLPPAQARLLHLPFGMQMDSVLWQRRAAETAQRLHTREQFDVVHHVSYSADWMPAGALDVDAPTVWGPVGGAAPAVRPWQLRYLGARGFLTELLHDLITGLFRRAFGRHNAQAADVVVVNSQDVANALKVPRYKTVVHPHAVAEPGLGSDRPVEGQRRAAFIARLIPWKGLRLALYVLAEPAAAGWTLDVVGDGPERAAGEALARDLGIADRVTFHGRIPLEDLRDFLSGRDVLLALGLHEGASFTVAEAVAQGCPVVAVDRGGNRALLDQGEGTLVPVSRTMARDLAQAMARIGGRLEPSARWSADRLPELVDELYEMAIDRHSSGRS